ncbi:flagellar brake protein [Scleromatobacter humisilvae]|uniref:Flagellar brake protein YcgR n=1 Tax=Scleromatobacter humisilvae TaxID=2897159 RepID=A0A9X1YHV6_9BURK|nr:flagellar brake protein [Scleromatobacter humisilvae]MCK9684697.1 flagellar brake protein [Scleromatobacter humisilvae]
MFEDTRPASLDDLGSGDALAEFRVTAPGEIRALLKQLMDDAVPLNLSASDGSAYTTMLWTVDPAAGRVSFTADMMAPAVHDIVEADECAAVAYLDRVKVQFDVTDLVVVQGHKASVLQARLPAEMFRFQRRNTFRVRTLERTAPTASFRHPGIPDMSLALRVLDVSIGGCALLQPANVPLLQPGAVIKGVRLSLDADTQIDAGLMLHHVTSTGAENGSVRLGCEIVGMGPTAQRALQVYIDQTQKRRRMMSHE